MPKRKTIIKENGKRITIKALLTEAILASRDEFKGMKILINLSVKIRFENFAKKRFKMMDDCKRAKKDSHFSSLLKKEEK